ncbi:MAG: hypothetical protein IVW36_09510 [Dehalococcoidia bacterium]|nr:hypothetical protein [Dehalococcoidia bacterium]
MGRWDWKRRAAGGVVVAITVLLIVAVIVSRASGGATQPSAREGTHAGGGTTQPSAGTPPGGGGVSAAVCAPGVPNCVDKIVGGGGTDGAACRVEEGCATAPPSYPCRQDACPPVTSCLQPRPLAPSAPSGTPAGVQAQTGTACVPPPVACAVAPDCPTAPGCPTQPPPAPSSRDGATPSACDPCQPGATPVASCQDACPPAGEGSAVAAQAPPAVACVPPGVACPLASGTPPCPPLPRPSCPAPTPTLPSGRPSECAGEPGCAPCVQNPDPACGPQVCTAEATPPQVSR